MPSRAVLRAEETYGSHLLQWRRLRGLTAEQVAERADISTRTLRRLENGSASVSLEAALSVMHALGILDVAVASINPLNSDVGRLRATEELPKRVRPRKQPRP
jgi:transcriptional regulator with XRE-family HTH domain